MEGQEGSDGAIGWIVCEEVHTIENASLPFIFSEVGGDVALLLTTTLIRHRCNGIMLADHSLQVNTFNIA